MSRPRRFLPPIAGARRRRAGRPSRSGSAAVAVTRPRRPGVHAASTGKTGWEALDKWVGGLRWRGSGRGPGGRDGIRRRPAARPAGRPSRSGSAPGSRLAAAAPAAEARRRPAGKTGWEALDKWVGGWRRRAAAAAPAAEAAAAPSGKTGWEALDKWVGGGAGRAPARPPRPRRAPAGGKTGWEALDKWVGGTAAAPSARRPAPPPAGPGARAARWRRARVVGGLRGGRRPDGLPQAPLRRQVGTSGSGSNPASRGVSAMGGARRSRPTRGMGPCRGRGY